MNTISKRSIADRLFDFFTNDVVLSTAIILSTTFVFLSGYKNNIFLYIDAFFTLFFLFEAIVKICCISPAPGRRTFGEKFRYYWFGKYDIEHRTEKKSDKDVPLDENERKIKEYRDRQYQLKKEKEKNRKKGFLRKHVFSFFFDGDNETNHWNQFDFIITLVALPSLLNFFQDVDIQTNLLLSLRTLRVFRALRIAKAARIMRFIPDIDKLVMGIKSALKSGFVVVLGFLLFMLITSILSSTLFGDIAPQYFGTPGLSLYSTFRLFTIEAWFDIPDAIAAQSSEGVAIFAKIYFSIFLFIGGIIGISLINSFFVDAMAEDNNEDVLIKLEDMEKMIKCLQEQLEQKEKGGQEEPKDEKHELDN